LAVGFRMGLPQQGGDSWLRFPRFEQRVDSQPEKDPRLTPSSENALAAGFRMGLPQQGGDSRLRFPRFDHPDSTKLFKLAKTMMES
jgi:hypothetical protein